MLHNMINAEAYLGPFLTSLTEIFYENNIIGAWHVSKAAFQRCSVKKRIIKNSVKLTGKFLCRGLLLKLQAYYFIEKETLAQVFCLWSLRSS